MVLINVVTTAVPPYRRTAVAPYRLPSSSKEELMHARTLAFQLGISHRVFDMNTADVSHEESLVTPPRGGSCLNQVVGHLTRTRNMALGSMGQQSPYPMEEFDP